MANGNDGQDAVVLSTADGGTWSLAYSFDEDTGGLGILALSCPSAAWCLWTGFE